VTLGDVGGLQMTKFEYWYARRFPVGHWRNAMAPISPKAKRVLRVFVAGVTLGMLAFFIGGFLGSWQIGFVIFAVLAGASGWYFVTEPARRVDRFHTVEDYREGRVPGYGHVAAKVPGRFALDAAFAGFSEHWRPRTVASLNGQEVKLVKLKGSFPWHRHDDVDEMFLVWKGEILLEFRDRAVPLRAGEGFVVPRGVEHRPVAGREAQVLLFEPAGVRNTGNIEDPVFTAPSAKSTQDAVVERTMNEPPGPNGRDAAQRDGRDEQDTGELK
jgi:mannose-6-phosphate isomerase-like protein (cupin superfamily)